jgi:tRNA-dihydrouridine synthase 2
MYLYTELVNQYAWATPTSNALRIIQEFAPIVEIGSGANAYWATYLHRNDVDVVAYDINVEQGGKIPSSSSSSKSQSPTEPHDNMSSEVPLRVQPGGPSVLAQHSDRALFLCYPDETGDGMAAECLEYYTGSYVIHVGETIWDANLSVDQCPWGRSSSSDFQQRLATEFHCILKMELPNWLHVRDTISVWKRTEICTMVFAADSDNQDNEEDEEVEYRHIPVAERLPINLAAPCCAHLLPPSPAAETASANATATTTIAASRQAIKDDHTTMPGDSTNEIAATTTSQAVQQPSTINHQQEDITRMSSREAASFSNMNAAEEEANESKSNYHGYRGEALAPMVRASTTPLRVLALQYGADFCYTEELVDRSISDTVRVENKRLGTIDYIKDISKVSAKVQRRLAREGGPPLMLRIDPNREAGKLACQIGSGEPELALAGALHVHRDVESIDINMGCPKKFSVSGGMGSALLTDPERASRILRTLATNVPKPISCKIRLLPQTQDTMDLLTALIERGQAKAVAIHARRVGDPEIKPAQWDDLEEVLALARAKFPHTRFLVNGDFYTRQEWIDFRQRTGVDGVLWARPALYNTSIFRKPRHASTSYNDQPTYGYNSPLLLDRTQVIQEYLQNAIRYETHYKNVKYVVAEMMNTRRTPSPRVPFLVPPQEAFVSGGQTIGLTSACHDMESLCKLWNVDQTAYTVKSTQCLSTTSSDIIAVPTEGEHRYEESYLLRTEGGSKEARPSSPKRAKTEF